MNKKRLSKRKNFNKKNYLINLKIFNSHLIIKKKNQILLLKIIFLKNIPKRVLIKFLKKKF